MRSAFQARPDEPAAAATRGPACRRRALWPALRADGRRRGGPPPGPLGGADAEGGSAVGVPERSARGVAGRIPRAWLPRCTLAPAPPN